MTPVASPPAVVAISRTTASRAALSRQLRAARYRVKTAPPGARADELLTQHRPDVIVIDGDPRDAEVAALLHSLHTLAPALRVPVIRIGGGNKSLGDAEADFLLPSPASGAALRQAVHTAVRLRRAEQAGGVRAGEARLLDTILENTIQAVAYFDRELRFVRTNALAAAVAGLDPGDMTGRAFSEVFPELAELHAAMRQAMATKRLVEVRQFRWFSASHPEWGTRLVDIALVPVLTEEGEVEGLVTSALEVTDRVREHEQLLAAERARASLAENLKTEIAHRVRDHLAMVTGLLQVQVAGQSDDRVAAALRGAVSRIRTIGELHDVMYAPTRERVPLRAILQRVAEGAREVFAGREAVELSVSGEEIDCSPVQVTNLCVITHELVANAVRHGGPGPDGRRRVEVETSHREGEVRLLVWGSGHPVPRGFDIQAQQGTGLRVVSDLVSQYGGSLTLRPRAGGTLAVVTLGAEQLA